MCKSDAETNKQMHFNEESEDNENGRQSFIGNNYVSQLMRFWLIWRVEESFMETFITNLDF